MELSNVIEAILTSSIITAIIYFTITWYAQYNELKQLKKELDSYLFVVEIGKCFYLDESFRFRSSKIHLISNQLNINRYCGSCTYIRSDVANYYKDKGVLDYSTHEFISSKDVISHYQRFKYNLNKLPEYKYYLTYRPLSDLKEYFEDVDNPTQDEINYVKMVLPETEYRYYKELD